MPATEPKSGLRRLRLVLWALVLVALAGLGWLKLGAPRLTEVAELGTTQLGQGDYRLAATDGSTFTAETLKGQPSAVFFGFTHCPDVCPTTLNEMTGFIEAMGADAERIHWLFVSVDWERDTPEALAGYLEAFDPRIVGLSGSEVQVAAAARAFRVYYRRVPLEGGGYTMDHSASVFLLDAEGRFAGTIDSKESRDVALEKLRMLAGRDRSSG